MSWPVLSVTIFLPLVGALFLMTLRGDDEAVQRNARWIALWTTLITFAVSLVMVWLSTPVRPNFSSSNANPGSAAQSPITSVLTGFRCRS